MRKLVQKVHRDLFDDYSNSDSYFLFIRRVLILILYSPYILSEYICYGKIKDNFVNDGLGFIIILPLLTTLVFIVFMCGIMPVESVLNFYDFEMLDGRGATISQITFSLYAKTWLITSILFTFFIYSINITKNKITKKYKQYTNWRDKLKV